MPCGSGGEVGLMSMKLGMYPIIIPHPLVSFSQVALRLSLTLFFLLPLALRGEWKFGKQRTSRNRSYRPSLVDN